jgi:hypothetical protein
MKTWLLTTIDPSERTYKGNEGYADVPQTIYCYDSFVPNYRNVAVGDVAILRDKSTVLGSAVIEGIEQAPGAKLRLRCPSCGETKLKERTTLQPRFRCECRAEFESPVESKESCTVFVARFGASFQELAGQISIAALWGLAPRLNRQHAILELDSEQVGMILARLTASMGRADEPSLAAKRAFREGDRTAVLANRYERDPKARRACLDHYGYSCSACGFLFVDKYGEIGQGVVEVHHLEPLGENPGRRGVDPIADLRPLCANCHTIVHQQTPPLSIEGLSRLLRSHSSATADH